MINSLIPLQTKKKSKQFSYYEYKYIVHHEKLAKIKSVLDTMCGGIDPYPSGIVDSIYYDSLNQNAHEQCINGDYYKSKFRIRGYGDGTYKQIHLKIKKMSLFFSSFKLQTTYATFFSSFNINGT